MAARGGSPEGRVFRRETVRVSSAQQPSSWMSLAVPVVRDGYSLPPMRLQDLIPTGHILLDLEAADKWEVIDRLIENLRTQGALPGGRAEAFREAVVQRERSMSTGMERGIAIPHAAVDGIERVAAGLALVRGPAGDGVNFDSIDAGPAWIVVLLLIPRPQKLLHIRTLADLARHLGNEDVRQALRRAKTQAEAWKALAKI